MVGNARAARHTHMPSNVGIYALSARLPRVSDIRRTETFSALFIVGRAHVLRLRLFTLASKNWSFEVRRFYVTLTEGLNA